MEILWPPYNQISNEENNNSIVLILRLNNVSLVLTGDAEENVWNQIATQIPQDTQFFKVPHHGSVNGTFDKHNNTPWFSNCPPNAHLGISCHISRKVFPDQQVINLFKGNFRQCFRTDEHYYIMFQTDGNAVQVKYSHF